MKKADGLEFTVKQNWELIRKMFSGEPMSNDVLHVVNPFNKVQDEYLHFEKFEHIVSNDNYEAWSGRGDAYKLVFYDESGGAFALCFGFHKGFMNAWLEKRDEEPQP
jgi:hypothetical protein